MCIIKKNSIGSQNSISPVIFEHMGSRGAECSVDSSLSEL